MGQYGAVMKEKPKAMKTPISSQVLLPPSRHNTPLDRASAVALAGNLLLSTCIVSVGLMTTVCAQISGHRHWHQYG